MIPSVPMKDVVDGASTDAKAQGDAFAVRTLRQHAPDQTYSFIRKFCWAGGLPSGVPALSHGVLGIVHGRPQEEMVWTHAGRGIAMMAYLEPSRDGADRPDIRKAVGRFADVVGMRDPNPPIASPPLSASPEPASRGTASLVNVCPETVAELGDPGRRTTGMTTVASPAHGAPARKGLELFPALFALDYHHPSTKRRPLGSAVFAEDTRELRGHNRKRRQSCMCPQHRQYNTESLGRQ
jgi:hypothetical protein